MARNVKKFSDLITESESKRSDIMEIINKLGYSSIDEIKKEKSILSKLEALLKELPGMQDVSEDEAEDIEDKVKKDGEPKSIEDKEGEFEEQAFPAELKQRTIVVHSRIAVGPVCCCVALGL